MNESGVDAENIPGQSNEAVVIPGQSNEAVEIQLSPSIPRHQTPEPQPGSSNRFEAHLTGHQTPVSQPGTSRTIERQPDNPSSLEVIETLAPLPGPSTSRASKSRAKQHSEIFTSTPLKTQLEVKEEKRQRKKQDDVLKKLGTKKKSTKPKKVVKRPVKKTNLPAKKKPCVRNLRIDDSESESCDETQLCDDDELDDVDLEDNNTCLVCGEFGRDNEIWYRCVSCGNWAHSECSGWDSAVQYTCDVCIKAHKKSKK